MTDQGVLDGITIPGEGRKQTLYSLHYGWRRGEGEGDGRRRAGRRGGGVYNLSEMPRVRLSDSDAREKSGLTARAKGDKSQVVLSSV